MFAYAPSDGVFAYDVASGALLARTSSYSLFPEPRLIVDEVRQRLLFWSGSSDPFLMALSFDTLQPIGRTSLPPVASSFLSSLALDVSPVSATIFAIQNAFVYNWSEPNQCKSSTLLAMNVDTGEVRKTVDLTSTVRSAECQLNLVRLTESSPPLNIARNATGNRVALTWSPSPATRYEIQAGSAPGLTNIGTFSVTDPHLTVDGVPPGVYYVRVRAVNVVGKSAPSQELRVVVP
jgi:hypothetical protein